MQKYLLSSLLLLSSTTSSFAQCTAEILQTAPLQVCEGGSITLNATAGGATYQWYKNGTPVVGATSSAYTESATAAGIFTYTVDIDFGTCTDISDPFDCYVYTTPVVTTATNNGPLCDGQNLVLEASGTPGSYYFWSGPMNYTANTPIAYLNGVTVAGSGTYYVEATLASSVNNMTFACVSAPISISVSVVPIPNQPNLNSNSPVCAGTNLDLSSSLVVGMNYLWQGPNGYTSTQQNPSILNASPLNSGTYTLTVSNGSCDAQSLILVQVNQTPYIAGATYVDPAYPAPGSITLNGLPNGTFMITYVKDGVMQAPVSGSGFGGSFTLAGLGEGTYSDIIVIQNGCSSNAIGPYVLVEQNQIPDVWPGDANDDHWADNNDVLDLGLAYGATGTPRTGASLNWIAQLSTDWGMLQTNGADMKHADCNGDGTVDADDQDAITQNYGQYHPKGVHAPQAKSASLPDLYFDLTGITFTAGTTVSVPIKLGTSSMPMTNILGIAAKVKVQDVMLDNAPTINNTTSWIGTGSSAMNFYKDVSANQTDWALVRTDHNNVSGDGTIATLVMDLPANSSGDAILYFEDVKIINSAGQEITDFNVVDDTATIVPLTVGNTTAAENKIAVVPNPSQGQATLQVTLAEATELQVHITDVLGREVWSDNVIVAKGTSNIALPAQLASGIYTVRTSGITTPAVKWLKK